VPISGAVYGAIRSATKGATAMVKDGGPSHRLSGVPGGTGVGSHRVNQATTLAFLPSVPCLFMKIDL
jgi:hypothetical protein